MTKKRLDVDSFTRYKIVDPLRFYKTVRTEEQARGKLAEIVNSSVRKILGRITLPELLSQKRTQIMSDISSAVKSDAAQIGVSVADVRIRRADLPLQVLQAINARMKTERERDAKEFRAQGQQQAQQIRAKAEKERTIIIAEAEKQAQIPAVRVTNRPLKSGMTQPTSTRSFTPSTVRWKPTKTPWLTAALLWSCLRTPNFLNTSEIPPRKGNKPDADKTGSVCFFHCVPRLQR